MVEKNGTATAPAAVIAPPHVKGIVVTLAILPSAFFAAWKKKQSPKNNVHLDKFIHVTVTPTPPTAATAPPTKGEKGAKQANPAPTARTTTHVMGFFAMLHTKPVALLISPHTSFAMKFRSPDSLDIIPLFMAAYMATSEQKRYSSPRNVFLASFGESFTISVTSSFTALTIALNSLEAIDFTTLKARSRQPDPTKQMHGL